MRTGRPTLALALMGLTVVLAGCGGADHPTAPQARASRAPSPTSSAVRRIRTIPPPGPATECQPRFDAAVARQLIGNGADVVVRVRTGPPTSGVIDHARSVPVLSYRVLAGTLRSGPPKVVFEAATKPSDTDFVPGKPYVVLLAHNDGRGVYQVAGGVLSEFTISGDGVANEQCPNYAGAPVATVGPDVPLSTLSATFAGVMG